MTVYFASDMHLRLDRPERGHRLARWVETLGPDDPLYLVGDVCDFWYASRQRRAGPLKCEGLRALARFRLNGGELTILPGNHDLWLGPYYEAELGARMVSEPFTVNAHGLRFHLTHGHRAGGRRAWKASMESHTFLNLFERFPEAVVSPLDRLLDRSNSQARKADEDRHIAVFHRHAQTLPRDTDIAVYGHVHRPVDDPTVSPRIVILGGWHQGASYLRVDEQGARLMVEPVGATAVV